MSENTIDPIDVETPEPTEDQPLDEETLDKVSGGGSTYGGSDGSENG